MKISLAEAINLKSILTGKQNELVSRRHSVSVVTVPSKDSTYTKPMYSVEAVTAEIEDIIKDSSKLTEILAKANVETTIEFGGENVSLSYALDIVKHLRSELRGIKQLASRSKETFNTRYGGEASYEIALYEPEIYAEKVVALEKQVNRLSILINTNNYSVFVEVPFADKYLA